MGRFFTGVLFALIMVGIIGGAYYLGAKNGLIFPNPSPKSEVSLSSSSSSPESTTAPKIESSPTPSADSQPGTVSGKLCYPSSFLPPGKIVAKEKTSGKIFSQNYAGSEKGATNSYSMSLQPGKYNLRYEANTGSNTLYGYQTTVCPTGQETTCGDTKQRILVSVEVQSGKTNPDANLCDFYYSDSNKPSF